MEPGEAGPALEGYLNYDLRSIAADEGGRTYGGELCDHARLFGTTAIVEVVSIDPVSLGVPVCDRDYSPGASLYAVSVVGNVDGMPLPVSLTTAYIFFSWMPDSPPEVGDVGLVTMREDAGEWLSLTWLPLVVTQNPSDVQPTPDSRETDLPDTFELLVQELEKRNTDFAQYCPSVKTAEETFGPWPVWARDPAYWYESCREGYMQEEPEDPYPPRTRDGG